MDTDGPRWDLLYFLVFLSRFFLLQLTSQGQRRPATVELGMKAPPPPAVAQIPAIFVGVFL